MTFTCAHCGRPADRDMPQPPPGITVVFICHDCAWAEDEGEWEDEGWDDPT